MTAAVPRLELAIEHVRRQRDRATAGGGTYQTWDWLLKHLEAEQYQLQTRPAPRARVQEAGAFDAWLNAVRRGVFGQKADQPSTWRLDDLHRAACREAMGREFDRLGLPAIGDRCRREAAEIYGRATE